MLWYKAGTVSVALNSTTVTGSGTQFAANCRAGDAFRGPDGRWYEVVNPASDTVLSISPAYQGSTASGGSYALAPMQGYVKDSADALRALVNQFGSTLAVLGTSGTLSGVRSSLQLTTADGLNEGAANKYFTEARVRTAALTGFTLVNADPSGQVTAADSVLGALQRLQAQLVNIVGSGYIDGLIPTFNSSTSISVTAGTCYIPGFNRNYTATAALTLSGLNLTANTWYYLYAFNNNGVLGIELNQSVPGDPYSGSSRTKQGDTSRRFLCSLRSNSGSGLLPFQIDVTGMLRYIATVSASPFRIISGATNTSPTIVSLSALVPRTTRNAKLVVVNGGTPVLFLGDTGTNSIFDRVAAGMQVGVNIFVDAGQQFMFYNSASGGAATFDVAGYGMER
ncbi:Prophage PssSM-03, Orf10 [Pseudomonas syringae]|uniref:hypothetical protein n=1 Tax=Pseudomonas syringae TaxID=317 RepID=UPI001FD9880F|nr:hypothetical protein [Pseudomonas syringae]MCI3945560.1 Prophage PssSM-03, Orf10 [Pseudomonas syringae]